MCRPPTGTLSTHSRGSSDLVALYRPDPVTRFFRCGSAGADGRPGFPGGPGPAGPPGPAGDAGAPGKVNPPAENPASTHAVPGEYPCRVPREYSRRVRCEHPRLRAPACTRAQRSRPEPYVSTPEPPPPSQYSRLLVSTTRAGRRLPFSVQDGLPGSAGAAGAHGEAGKPGAPGPVTHT
jgi:hypothetical protein